MTVIARASAARSPFRIPLTYSSAPSRLRPARSTVCLPSNLALLFVRRWGWLSACAGLLAPPALYARGGLRGRRRPWACPTEPRNRLVYSGLLFRHVRHQHLQDLAGALRDHGSRTVH